nr:SIR2 family protein [uncultured Carboxylicivirga sp.]
MRKRKSKTKNKGVFKTNKCKRLICDECRNRIKNRHTSQKKCFTKKKTLVLFLGAGAAKAWDGPICSDIDTIIKEDRRFRTSENITIGTYIFRKLEEFYGNVGVVNFETFLGAIEAIYDYIISATNGGGTGPDNTSFSSALYDLKGWIENIKDYDIQQRGNGLVHISFPRNNPDFFETNEPAIVKRLYFSELFKHYYRLVANAIETYDSNYQLEEYEGLNNSLLKFISYYHSCGYRIRVYTTNYDRIFTSVVRQKYKVFDGFNVNDVDEFGVLFPYNSNKILKDKSCFCHYSLHGSVYWHKVFDGEYDFKLNPFEVSREIEFTNSQATNPNQIIVPINIVTGYNKLQRISLKPLNSIYSAFLYDCNRADLLITVGYSFGDPHLNRILEEPLLKESAEYYNITFQSDPESYLGSIEMRRLSDLYPLRFSNLSIEENWITSTNGAFKERIYYKGFDKFLNEKEWFSKR